jgi:hypothetical protein
MNRLNLKQWLLCQPFNPSALLVSLLFDLNVLSLLSITSICFCWSLNKEMKNWIVLSSTKILCERFFERNYPKFLQTLIYREKISSNKCVFGLIKFSFWYLVRFCQQVVWFLKGQRPSSQRKWAVFFKQKNFQKYL